MTDPNTFPFHSYDEIMDAMTRDLTSAPHEKGSPAESMIRKYHLHPVDYFPENIGKPLTQATIHYDFNDDIKQQLPDIGRTTFAPFSIVAMQEFPSIPQTNGIFIVLGNPETKQQGIGRLDKFDYDTISPDEPSNQVTIFEKGKEEKTYPEVVTDKSYANIPYSFYDPENPVTPPYAKDQKQPKQEQEQPEQKQPKQEQPEQEQPEREQPEPDPTELTEEQVKQKELENQPEKNEPWRKLPPTQRQINFLKWFSDPATEEELKQSDRGTLSDRIGGYQDAYEFIERDFTLADRIAFAEYTHKDKDGIPDKFPELTTYDQAMNKIKENRETGDYRKNPDDKEYNIAGITENQLTAAIGSAFKGNALDNAIPIAENLSAVKNGESRFPNKAILDPENDDIPRIYLNAVTQVNNLSEQPMDLATANWTDVRNNYMPLVNTIMKQMDVPQPQQGSVARRFKKQQKQLSQDQIRQARKESQNTRSQTTERNQ